MNDAAPTRINALTSWRGIFILSVVLFHSGEELFMELATSGVVGFFIMSGFLMRMKHQPEPIRAHGSSRSSPIARCGSIRSIGLRSHC